MSLNHSNADNAQLHALVSYARQYSPFYAATLAGFPMSGWVLADLPLIDPAQFWHVDGELKNWPVLTAPPEDAYVFRSGGSTGKGKFSLCTREEWQRLCARYGAAVATRLSPGDRVANLFFSGNLYASHLFIHTALSYVPFPICEFPYTGNVELPVLASAIEKEAINVLAVVPAHLMQLVDYLEVHQRVLPCVTSILYGGDSLFPDQLPRLSRVFPRACFESIGYASVDIGLLGASTPDCHDGEHRTFDGETILEILDEDSGSVIDDMHRPGLLVATSLTRRLTPLIRCPTGDLAAWCEPPGPERKFILKGRSKNSHQIRIGIVSLTPESIDQCLQQILAKPVPWQLLLTRETGIDCVALHIGAQGNTALATQLRVALLQTYPEMESLITLGQLSFSVEWHQSANLQISARTGKLQRIIDQRHDDPCHEEVR